MAVPKKKMSKSQTRQRRAHDALTEPARSTCSKCGATKRPHHVCPECGHYRDRQVFQVEAEEEV
jgi:large subunit ribosomal protein L32